MTPRLAWVLAVSIFIASMSGWASAPMRFNYQGKLTDGGGVPLNGNHTVFFTLWNGGSAGAAGSGTKVFEEQATVNFATTGVGNHPVGGGTNQALGGLTTAMMRGATTLFLQVAVDDPGNVVLPRTQVESVPYAITSADSEVRIPISQPVSFPITISQPGSYYLTGNITGVPGAAGIQITTGSVTLDLVGFQLAGVPGSLDGIANTGGPTSVVIRNGHIHNWGIDGVGGTSSNFWRVEDIISSDNGDEGIIIGQSGVIRNCIADGNVGTGLFANAGSTIHGCSARSNTADGIGGQATIHECLARLNGGRGISADFASVVSGCVAEQNTGDGISGASGTHIYGCTSRNNNGDGIVATNDFVYIHDNHCISNNFNNLTAGIRIAANDSRVEGNSCVGNDFGIKLDGNGNFVSRNTCSGNTVNNWSTIAGNTILVIQGSSAGAFTGNSGGAAPGSTDPNANFTF